MAKSTKAPEALDFREITPDRIPVITTAGDEMALRELAELSLEDRAKITVHIDPEALGEMGSAKVSELRDEALLLALEGATPEIVDRMTPYEKETVLARFLEPATSALARIAEDEQGKDTED